MSGAKAEARADVPVAALGVKALRRRVMDGFAVGRPTTGPLSVHVDITNACNAKCVTCWDHSPLLTIGRSAAWKKRRLDLDVFRGLVDELAAMGSVRSFVLSGMGEPLVNPDVYDMIAAVKERGWHLTLMTNLVAADIERLETLGVDNLLVGVQGVSPDVYAAFHPGWNERHFFRLCGYLRRMAKAGARCRHVHVINRDTAPEVVEMVRFGRMFSAERVNYKLASLTGGTEACAITEKQRDWLIAEGVPQARALAAELGVRTNLDLFEQQLSAAVRDIRTSTPIEDVGCFMGHVYTRITVDLDVLYCCNTEVRVGNLADTAGRFTDLWYGARWDALRDRLAAGDYFPGCHRCGKFEQNRKWGERVEEHLGEGWRARRAEEAGARTP